MYPEILLPRICKVAPTINEDSYFVRAVNQNVKDFYDYNQQAFYPSEIIDEILKPNGEKEIYSLSLFFGEDSLSTYEISVVPKDKSLFDVWDGSEEIEASSIEYEVNTRFPVFLNGLLNYKSTTLKDENGCSIECSTKVFHSPTRSNFLHCQISVFKNNEGQPLRSGKTNIKKRIAQTICENILYMSIDTERTLQGF